MMLAGIRRFCLTVPPLFVVALSLASPGELAATQPAINIVAPLKWIDSLDVAYLQAQRTEQPILVLVEDDAHPSSERAIDAVASAASRDPANSWILVRLDLPQSKDAEHTLGIATAPAIGAVRADGSVAGIKAGPLDDNSLPSWIISIRASATSRPSLQSSSRQENITELASQDEATRELAVRRLEQDRAAADEVVDVLYDGPMSARLAALDLLEQWGAPVGGIDLWNPSTLTQQRRNTLAAWSRSGVPSSQPSGGAKSSASIADVNVELDALLNAPTDIEARGIREQMAHFGPAALPLIRRRIEADPSDADKQRLMALRYRLVAGDLLAETWPGGFDRLASNDPFVRRGAVDELSQHVTGEDSPLLVELFSDNDEFVRERSLRLLQSVSGAESSRALIRLLGDPEPNVRAAVLKTLAEKPDPSLAPDLARYARSEKDPDLIVHCIGVLQKIPGDESVNCLKDLLHHPAWRIRAEACEAIHQKMQAHEQIEPVLAASLVEALRKCLDDPDDFVISQAAIALVSFNIQSANRSVMDSMERHPSIGLDVLNSIGRDRESVVMLLPAIRKLASNPKPQFRASAIRAICRFAPNSAGHEVTEGLNDPDPTVRQEAATGLATALEEIFPENGTLFAEPGNYASTHETVDVGQWVRDFIAGSRRPSWMLPLKPRLEKMIASPDEQARVAAAMSLCALGGESEAWPVLQNSADSELARGTEAAALPWLGWDRRKLLWDKLISITPDGQMSRLIEEFAAVPDPRAVRPLWALLRDPPRDTLFSAVNQSLQNIYGLNDSVTVIAGQGLPPPTAQAQKCLADIKPMLDQGGELQKVEALCLLFRIDQNAVGKSAGEIYRKKKNSPSLRCDALKILLLSQPDKSAEPIAAEAISDPAVRNVAVSYLAVGGQAVWMIRNSVYLNPSTNLINIQFTYAGQGGSIIPIHVPAGLNAAYLGELLSDDDQDVAAYAGYLLSLQRDHRGIEPLLRAAQAHGFQDDQWGKLAYRAITTLDDDSFTPVLQRIYESYATQTWELREFYWTIRAMHGPNVLKLRKKIRDEVGMQQLQ